MRERIRRHLASVLEGTSRAAAAVVGAEREPVPAAPGRSVQAPRPLRRTDLETEPAVDIPPEFSGRDYTIYLLRIAAGIEHALMAQYLYAAYSLGGPDVPARLQEAVRSWQETILGVAKEEMGHLITVQNLLTVLGAPRTFDRDDYPSVDPLYPYGFYLEPLSLESLAAYVIAESPQDWTGPEADEIRERARGGVGGIKPVGRLFAELIALVGDPSVLPDSAFLADTVGFQAGWDEWGRGYREGQRGAEAMSSLDLPAPELVILPVDSRATALAALRAVADQGEGFDLTADEDESHFERFLAVYRAVKDLGDGIGDVVRPLATNPSVGAQEVDGDPADVTTPTAITHPEAQLWGHLFNVRYRKLLVSLSHAFELADDPVDPTALSPRGWLIHRSFGEMYNLRAIAGLLVRLPARADDPGGRRAGPPFDMPYTLVLPSTEADRWRVHRDLLDASARLIRGLRDVVGPGDGQDYLTALSHWDDIELGHVEQLIAAPVPSGRGATP